MSALGDVPVVPVEAVLDGGETGVAAGSAGVDGRVVAVGSATGAVVSPTTALVAVVGKASVGAE